MDTTHKDQDSARIVVGVDGSDSSIDALRRGARMAEALGVRLEAITVWQYPLEFGGYVTSEWSPESDARSVLDEAAQQVFGGTPPDWFVPVVCEGATAQVLIDASKGAEMLIVGSRGHGGFVGLLLGSVSSRCAEYSHCPVLVVHNGDREVAPAAVAGAVA
ncbi:universal stress protein [Lacisediminihabitans profunda]|uniref:Universal stress protein n=1 Tax=Lacisediminihabitans profunda TaxID=2594790 RepID=A0A5C8UKH0_9MICO|nr:universal stress protein [Lacisediminihabitans profunda]TXN28307.1 universal stress protein [Lacisediminihabitans profunda]